MQQYALKKNLGLAWGRSSRQEVFCKKGVLEILQNSQENTCESLLLKKRLWHRCFRVNFANFLRTFIISEHLR